MKEVVNEVTLKQQLHSLWMVESKTITKQLTKFKKILDDLVNIEDKYNTLLLFVHYLDPLNTSRTPYFMVKKELSPCKGASNP